MLEYDVVLVNACISFLSVVIGGYVMSKIVMRNAENTIETMIEEKKKDVVEWLRSENGSKFIYSIGALIAQGAKGGFGIQKTSGKFSLQNLIMDIAGRYIGDKFGVGTPQEQPQPQTENLLGK